MKAKKIRFRSSAFTLAELIVVITVLAILATVGFVALSGHLSSARDSSRLSEVGMVSRAVELSAVRDGKYPMPVAAEGVALRAFTGGASGNAVVTQWAATPANVRDLGGSFGKRKPTGPFVYSVLGDGAAYQVAAEFENSASRVPPGVPGGVPEAYAAPKTAYVDGNYLADPSLPSLVVSSGSVTGTWLFSPDACFVTNGGPNLFSTNSGCVPKKSLALKSLDPALVGYWDMETLCVSGSCGPGNDGKLADLSGNGNIGTVSWTLASDGIVGKAKSFTGWGLINQIEVPNSSTLDIWGMGASITYSAILKLNALSTTWQNILYKGVLPDCPSGAGCSNRQFATFINVNGYIHQVSTPSDRVWTSQINVNTPWWAIQPNKDYLITAVIDPASWSMKTFLNGRVEAQIAYTWSIRNSTGSLFIWANFWSYSTNGTLDEIKIYNRPLTNSEIRQQAKVLWY